MFNNPYMSAYGPQNSLERINNQIAELEKLKAQIPIQQVQHPTNLTQNFQLAPSSQNNMRYANTINDVEKELVISDTAFFSKDLSILWIKNAKGEIRSFELNEIISKDDKDIQIEYLQAQLNELRGMIKDAKSDNQYVDEPVEKSQSADVSIPKSSTKKSKQSAGDI